MYFTPKMKPSMVTCEKTTGQSNDEPSTSSCFKSLRRWLLFWASLRLAVSVLWTGVLMLMTYQTLDYYSYCYQRQSTCLPDARNDVKFGVLTVVLQLLEFGMIVTFIVAGVKKCARLYRIYYRYCILTLVIYIIAVIVTLATDYDDAYYYGDGYLTYHINDLPIVDDDNLVFGVAAFVDICLELLLINLIKRLIQKYSNDGNSETCEKV